MSDSDARLCYRPHELEGILGIGRSSIYTLIRRGEIPSVKLGKSILIPKDQLREVLAAKATGNVVPLENKRRW